MADRVVGYSQGVFHASVCAPGAMSGEEVAAAFERQSPCGTEAGWTLSSEPTFRDGTGQGFPCDKDPSRRHWLLDA